MHIKSFTFNQFQENTYVLYDDTKECVIIDPGCYDKREEYILEEFITQKSLIPVILLNTHCHIDHVLGNSFVAKKWELDLKIHQFELDLLNSVSNYANAYGFMKYKKSPEPISFLSHEDEIVFGESKIQVLFTPGHSPGHICFYNSESNIVISGDLIFRMSIGRTDLPGGDHNTLIKSINTQLVPLGNQTKIYPGHGLMTTLNFEKVHNPFLQ